MAWGALIGGALSLGGSIAGSLIGGSQSAKAQDQANALNLQIAREQMAFQREGMQNRHQWEVADLRKAGLNPILSAGGQPPVPAGASANMLSTKPNRGELYLNTASALQDIKLKKELAKTEQSKQELNRATTKRAKGTFSIPGFYSGPANNPVSTWLLSQFANAKHAGKAAKNFATRGTFADKH